MPLVIGLYDLDGSGSFVQGRVGEQALACGKDVAEAGVLGDHGSPRSEVRCTSVAEPARAKSDILILRNGEFGVRAAHVVAVNVDVLRQWERVTDAPSIPFEHEAVIRVIASECEFELRTTARRQLKDLLEFFVFAPAVLLSVQVNLAPLLPPVANRRVMITSLSNAVFPEVKNDRLPCRKEVELL